MTTDTLTLADFLLARIDEDERWANASDGRWVDFYGDALDWSPERVLAECAAKRRIVELHATAAYHAGQFADAPEGDPFRTVYTVSLSTYDAVLRALALPYADHPDFRDEWQA